MKYVVFLLFLLVSAHSFAQTPGTNGNDSAYRSGRPLPPSMIEELHRSQKNRTLVYTDTVHAADLEKQHFNDSVQQNYADSAISMIDTAVSLPHKEWLDSELVEIPELARFGSHVHFNYPPSLMMETAMNPVSFDTTLVQSMNPVTLEQLPFFDQSPMPMPLEPSAHSESFLEAGAGNVLLPRVEGWFAQSLSERAALSINGNYDSYAASQSAIHQCAGFSAALDAQIGEDPAAQAFHSNDLAIEGAYSSKSVIITNISQTDHALSDWSGGASLNGNLSDNLHYAAHLEGDDWNDNVESMSEATLDAALAAQLDLAGIQVTINGNYTSASLSGDTSTNNGSVETSIDAASFEALVGDRNEHLFEWYAGVKYLGGSGVDGTSYSSILPVAKFRYQLNARWDVGAAFDPEAQLASARTLSGINPFYSPGVVLQFRQTDGALTVPVDARSVTMDNINLNAFMNYALSPDDEIRLDARYVTRDREPIFGADTGKNSATFFVVTPQNTDCIEATASGNFLLFARDVLSASMTFRSASLESGGTVPFEPTSKLDLEYHLNSMWDVVQPSIVIESISRSGASFFFLDVHGDAELSSHIQLRASLENVLGGASDFWPGYPENPRSIWASVRYLF